MRIYFGIARLCANSRVVASLRTRKRHLSRALLSSSSTPKRLKSARDTAGRATALKAAGKQSVKNTYQLHHYCAGTTAFRVHDPDPHAIDDGKVLGVRIDVNTHGQFVEPYYLFLHKVDDENLKLHKHTIPVHIPLTSLVTKYLENERPQQLECLVKDVRRELVAWHKRIAIVDSLRREIGLGPASNRDRDEDTMSEDESVQDGTVHGRPDIKKIINLDIPVREVQISWRNGAEARLCIDKDGIISKVVTRSENETSNQRWRKVERAIAGGDKHLGNVVNRLRQL